jgi:hypothetical protein
MSQEKIRSVLSALHTMVRYCQDLENVLPYRHLVVTVPQ